MPALFGGPVTFGRWLGLEASLAAGYASAMSVPGPRGIEATGLTTLVAVAAAALVCRSCRIAGAGLWLGLLPAAWLAYRHGFVRADGHLYNFAYLSIVWLLLAGLALERGRARIVWSAVLAVATVAALATTARVERPGGLRPALLVSGRMGLGNLWSYLHARAHIEALAAHGRERLAPLRIESDALARWRAAGATFDALPWDLLTLAANDLAWRPDPVLQLYQVSSRTLDERVAAHFASARAPDRIVVGFETIDARQLLWEAPASWRTLLARYAPAADQPFPDRLLLERRARPAVWSERPLGEVALVPGEWAPVPRAEPGERILLAIDFEPTLPGRLRSALFRTEPLFLAQLSAGGRLRRWRLVPGVAAAGLIVDLPARGPEDLARVAAGAASGYVRQIRLEGAGTAALRHPVRARWVAARLAAGSLGAQRFERTDGEGAEAGGETGDDGEQRGAADSGQRQQQVEAVGDLHAPLEHRGGERGAGDGADRAGDGAGDRVLGGEDERDPGAGHAERLDEGHLPAAQRGARRDAAGQDRDAGRGGEAAQEADADADAVEHRGDLLEHVADREQGDVGVGRGEPVLEPLLAT